MAGFNVTAEEQNVPGASAFLGLTDELKAMLLSLEQLQSFSERMAQRLKIDAWAVSKALPRVVEASKMLSVKDVEDEVLLTILGQAYVAIGMFTAALNVFARVREINDDPKNVGIGWMGTGDCHLRMRNVREAAKAYDEASKHGYPAAQLMAARAWRIAGDTAKARERLRELMANPADDRPQHTRSQWARLVANMIHENIAHESDVDNAIHEIHRVLRGDFGSSLLRDKESISCICSMLPHPTAAASIRELILKPEYEWALPVIASNFTWVPMFQKKDLQAAPESHDVPDPVADAALLRYCTGAPGTAISLRLAEILKTDLLRAYYHSDSASFISKTRAVCSTILALPELWKKAVLFRQLAIANWHTSINELIVNYADQAGKALAPLLVSLESARSALSSEEGRKLLHDFVRQVPSPPCAYGGGDGTDLGELLARVTVELQPSVRATCKSTLERMAGTVAADGIQQIAFIRMLPLLIDLLHIARERSPWYELNQRCSSSTAVAHAEHNEIRVDYTFMGSDQLSEDFEQLAGECRRVIEQRSEPYRSRLSFFMQPKEPGINRITIRMSFPAAAGTGSLPCPRGFLNALSKAIKHRLTTDGQTAGRLFEPWASLPSGALEATQLEEWVRFFWVMFDVQFSAGSAWLFASTLFGSDRHRTPAGRLHRLKNLLETAEADFNDEQLALSRREAADLVRSLGSVLGAERQGAATEPLEVVWIVDRVVKRFRDLNHTVKIEFAAPAAAFAVMRGELLESALYNLLDNAIRSVKSAGVSNPNVRVSVMKSSTDVNVSVWNRRDLNAPPPAGTGIGQREVEWLVSIDGGKFFVDDSKPQSYEAILSYRGIE